MEDSKNYLGEIVTHNEGSFLSFVDGSRFYYTLAWPKEKAAPFGAKFGDHEIAAMQGASFRTIGNVSIGACKEIQSGEEGYRAFLLATDHKFVAAPQDVSVIAIEPPSAAQRAAANTAWQQHLRHG